MHAAPSYTEIAEVIDRFVEGTSEDWEWEEYFLYMSYKDSFLECVASRVRDLV